MSLWTWINSKMKRLNWVDLALVKLCVAGFVLMIAKLWKPLLNLDWYWYAIIFVLAAIKPVYKWFEK